jgi:hypothetical protein
VKIAGRTGRKAGDDLVLGLRHHYLISVVADNCKKLYCIDKIKSFCYDALNLDESLAHLSMRFGFKPDTRRTVDSARKIKQPPVYTRNINKQMILSFFACFQSCLQCDSLLTYRSGDHKKTKAAIKALTSRLF